MREINEDDLLKAIEDSAGLVTTISKRLGVSWWLADKHIKQNEKALEAIKNEKEKLIDLAESKIIDSISGGNTQDAKWYLGCQGRKRGYGEKVDIEHSGSITKKYDLSGLSDDELETYLALSKKAEIDNE